MRLVLLTCLLLVLLAAGLGLPTTDEAPAEAAPGAWAGPDPALWCASAARVDPLDRSRKDPGVSPAHPAAHFAVTLHHQHTRELLPILGPTPQVALDRFLRCRVTGDVHPIEARLVDVAVSTAVHFGEPRIEIVSGYRSPKFNELWRKKGHEVSPRSKHMRGQALDFHLPQTHARKVAQWLWQVHSGGLGLYTESDFVHVDFGPKRRWGGS